MWNKITRLLEQATQYREYAYTIEGDACRQGYWLNMAKRYDREAARLLRQYVEMTFDR